MVVVKGNHHIAALVVVVLVAAAGVVVVDNSFLLINQNYFPVASYQILVAAAVVVVDMVVRLAAYSFEVLQMVMVHMDWSDQVLHASQVYWMTYLINHDSRYSNHKKEEAYEAGSVAEARC